MKLKSRMKIWSAKCALRRVERWEKLLIDCKKSLKNSKKILQGQLDTMDTWEFLTFGVETGYTNYKKKKK